MIWKSIWASLKVRKTARSDGPTPLPLTGEENIRADARYAHEPLNPLGKKCGTIEDMVSYKSIAR